MIIKSLSCLREPFKSKIEAFLKELDKIGLKYSIVETCRSLVTQQAYYAQGRKPLEEVNFLRAKAGLTPIQSSQNVVVTWTLDSPHLYGFAIDIVPLVNGKPAWNRYDLFAKIGEIAEKHGLEWGGRWEEKDYPHIQLPNWRAIKNKENLKPIIG